MRTRRRVNGRGHRGGERKGVYSVCVHAGVSMDEGARMAATLQAQGEASHGRPTRAAQGRVGGRGGGGRGGEGGRDRFNLAIASAESFLGLNLAYFAVLCRHSNPCRSLRPVAPRPFGTHSAPSSLAPLATPERSASSLAPRVYGAGLCHLTRPGALAVPLAPLTTAPGVLVPWTRAV